MVVLLPAMADLQKTMRVGWFACRLHCMVCLWLVKFVFVFVVWQLLVLFASLVCLFVWLFASICLCVSTSVLGKAE